MVSTSEQEVSVVVKETSDEGINLHDIHNIFFIILFPITPDKEDLI